MVKISAAVTVAGFFVAASAVTCDLFFTTVAFTRNWNFNGLLNLDGLTDLGGVVAARQPTLFFDYFNMWGFNIRSLLDAHYHWLRGSPVSILL